MRKSVIEAWPGFREERLNSSSRWNVFQSQSSPDGRQYIYEIKLDGYRAVAIKSEGKVSLHSRRKKSFNSQYPYLVLVGLGRVELPAYGLGNRRSIHLSYSPGQHQTTTFLLE